MKSCGGARRGVGRPRLAENEKKVTKVVSIRLALQEWQSLKAEAASAGKTLHAVIKSKLFPKT